MRIIAYYKKRKYLFSILVSFNVILAIFLIASATSFYYTAERKVLTVQSNANEKVLAQMKYNIDFMNDTLKSLAVYLYFESDIHSLLNARDKDVLEYQRKIHKLEQVAATYYNLIHSIVIYNSLTDSYYSTYFSSRGSNEIIDALYPLIQNLKEVPVMKLIPIKTDLYLRTEPDEFDLFTFFLPDKLIDGVISNALILNIKPDWLFNNIKAINQVATSPDNAMFIMDQRGRVFNPDQNKMLTDQRFKEQLVQYLQHSSKELDIFVYGEGKDKKVITILNTGTASWNVINVQPYAEILYEIRKLRMTVFITVTFFLLLSLVVSWWISHRLYRPIKSLVSRVRKQTEVEISSEGGPATDELSYLSNFYSEVIEKVTMFKNENASKQNIVRDYYIRKLLLDSRAYPISELMEDLKASGIHLDEMENYVVCVLKIDNFEPYVENTSPTDQILMNFAILNIMSEVILTKIHCEPVDMKTDHLVLLLHWNNSLDYNEELIASLVKDAQDMIHTYYKLSITAALSSKSNQSMDITDLYEQALTHIQYRLIFGKKSVITPSMLTAINKASKQEYPSALEKQWVEAIKTNDLIKQSQVLDELFLHIRSRNYHDMVQDINQLAVTFIQAVRELNQNRLTSSSKYTQLNQKLLEKETLDDIKSLFLLVSEDLKNQYERKDEIKNSVLIETIKEIVEANYKDWNMNLQEISGMMRMSPDYVGKLFKKTEGISVAEYMNEVRLNHAQQLLMNHSMSIKDIMEQTGFVSETSFFRLFKKKFGTTPKEYRLRKITDSANS